MTLSIFSRNTYDQRKNAVLTVTGALRDDLPLTRIFSFSSLSGEPKGLRIESVTFAIQEKMGFNLFWAGKGVDEDEKFIMPMESRGYFSFTAVDGLKSPPGADGLEITSFRTEDGPMPKTFLLMVDLTK